MAIKFSGCRWGAAALVVLGSTLSAACNGRPETAPVRGQITLSGRPTGPGKIFFIPNRLEGTEGMAAEGEFGRNGEYELTTFESGDGAIVGHHRVVIVNRTGTTEGGEEEATSDPGPIPDRYWDAESSLKAEVKRGLNTLNFELQP